MISFDVMEPGDQAELADHLRDLLWEAKCSGTNELAAKWLDERGWRSKLVALEVDGGDCDCAVIDIIYGQPRPPNVREPDDSLVGLLTPRWFVPDASRVYRKVLRAGDAKMGHCHAPDGDLLFPAPPLLQPRAKVRGEVHWFLGVESGLPAEYGVVTLEPAPVTPAALAARLGQVPELADAKPRDAAYYLRQVDRFEPGHLMGVDVLRVLTDAAIVHEISLHRAIKHNTET